MPFHSLSPATNREFLESTVKEIAVYTGIDK